MSKYGLFDENGHLQQYVALPDNSDPIDLPDGWTLRDEEGSVVVFETEFEQAKREFEEKITSAYNEFMSVLAQIGVDD